MLPYAPRAFFGLVDKLGTSIVLDYQYPSRHLHYRVFWHLFPETLTHKKGLTLLTLLNNNIEGETNKVSSAHTKICRIYKKISSNFI
uniref:Uncharacterized protein n=1 Tax=Arundo donax TaxID=35708 RepID=A0A0A9GNG5_ARUDO